MKKKSFFAVIKKKHIFWALGMVAIFVLFILSPTILASNEVSKYKIVIDAGHGGMDGGSVGASGTAESFLNLQYAQTLKVMAENYGLGVIMTRSNANGLYSSFASNKKKDDMKKRKAIIDRSGADMVISIHMNAFPTKSTRGAQVFYFKESEASKKLAENIQKEFVKNLTKARKAPDTGDYYMLNCTDKPSVIVECGFLSNVEEEQLLLKKEYMNQVCYSILCGILLSM